MRKLTQSLVVLTLLVAGGVAIAGPHGPGGHGPRGPGHRVLKLVNELDLTDDQRTQIKEIMEGRRDERQADRDEHRATMEAFKTELLSDAPNAKRLHQLADEKAAERQARMHEHIDDMVAVSLILTPAQKVELGQRMEEMHAEMKERRESFREEGGQRRGPRFQD